MSDYSRIDGRALDRWITTPPEDDEEIDPYGALADVLHDEEMREREAFDAMMDAPLTDDDRMQANLPTSDPLQRLLVTLRTYERLTIYADWAGEDIHKFVNRTLVNWLDEADKMTGGED